MTYNLIKTENLSKSYPFRGDTLEILKAVNLTIDVGQTIAITGPSGTGKSTLLHQLGLLEFPSSGKILFEGQVATDLTDNQRTAIRLHKIGFVFQFHHLLPEFTALENIILPALIAREDRAQCEARAMALIKQVKLEHRAHHKPGELSGGEQQRIALARALINNPVLILADEPTGNLDRQSAEELQDILWEICAENRAALVVVTHNQSLAQGAQHIYEMLDGRLLEPVVDY